MCAGAGGGPPALLTHKQRHGLFDVRVFRRGARHDREQRAPVVGSRDNDRLNTLVAERSAKTAVTFCLRSAIGKTLAQARFVDPSHGGAVNVPVVHELVSVLATD